MKSDEKVIKAIEATAEWLEKHPKETYPSVDRGNFTIAGCERRNLTAYYSMLRKDKRTLKGFYRALYQAIN